MVGTNNRSIASNPYRRKGQGKPPFQSPMVIVGIVLVVMFVVSTISSAGSNNSISIVSDDKKFSQLRATESEQAERPSDVAFEKQNAAIKMQQDIIHDEKKKVGRDSAFRMEAMQEYHFDDHKYYHKYQRGKPGAVIEDMLMAHAHAFHLNGTYGGCCTEVGANLEKHKELLDALGLSTVLLFKCPGDDKDSKARKSVVPREKYRRDDTRIWTPSYVDYLKSLVHYPQKDESEFKIAVHVRRGELSPCKIKNRGYHRYLPNKHYLDVIDLYNTPGAKVEIISESRSFETLDVFHEKGYQVNLDEDLTSIWRTFVTADVVILSRSDFSMIPAVCAMGQVVYTPYWHPPIRGWKRVPPNIMEQTDNEIERLRKTQCEL